MFFDELPQCVQTARGTLLTPDLAAALEDDQSRDGLHPMSHRGLHVGLDVELDDLERAIVLGCESVDVGPERFAGGAPLGPEVNENWDIGLEDFVAEVRIGDGGDAAHSGSDKLAAGAKLPAYPVDLKWGKWNAVERLPYILVLAIYSFMTVVHLLPNVIPERASKAVRVVASVGALIHIATLLAVAFTAGYPPGLPEALSATSAGIVVAYAWVGTGRVRALGMLLAPLALVLLGTSLVVPHSSVNAIQEVAYSPWLPVHLGLIFAGIAGFGLAAVVGALYLWARDKLKKKQFDGIRRLPSLETLDRIQFRAMLFGFIFLTLGIGAGGAWAAAILDGTWSFDGKVLFTLLIWFWYGLALQVRLLLGRRGRWTALFSIVGFVGLMVSLIGVRFLISGWHSYVG